MVIHGVIQRYPLGLTSIIRAGNKTPFIAAKRRTVVIIAPRDEAADIRSPMFFQTPEPAQPSLES
jgi:hypothetical protein